MDSLERLYRFIGFVCFVALTAIVGWQVFARYVLNDSPSWSEPLAMLLLLYAVLLGAAVGVRREFHMGLKWLHGKLGAGMQLAADRVAFVSIAGFGIGMIVYGYRMSARTWDYLIPGLNISMGVQYVALIAGGAAIAVFAIEVLFRRGER